LNEAKEFRIARGNPLLNPKSMADFSVKRRWDDDVIFRNQARGTDDRNLKKAFVNDLLRSDFHKKFMVSFHFIVLSSNSRVASRTSMCDRSFSPLQAFGLIVLYFPIFYPL
jgi:protein CWC15